MILEGAPRGRGRCHPDRLCGIPVAASAPQEAQDGWIDGRTGYAFREQAMDEWVAKLSKFLKCRPRQLALAEAARFMAESFDINRSSWYRNAFATSFDGDDRTTSFSDFLLFERRNAAGAAA